MPIENLIADTLYELPIDNFEWFINKFFSDRMRSELRQKKIKTYYDLIEYKKSSI